MPGRLQSEFEKEVNLLRSCSAYKNGWMVFTRPWNSVLFGIIHAMPCSDLEHPRILHFIGVFQAQLFHRVDFSCALGWDGLWLAPSSDRPCARLPFAKQAYTKHSFPTESTSCCTTTPGKFFLWPTCNRHHQDEITFLGNRGTQPKLPQTCHYEWEGGNNPRYTPWN